MRVKSASTFATFTPGFFGVPLQAIFAQSKNISHVAHPEPLPKIVQEFSGHHFRRVVILSSMRTISEMIAVMQAFQEGKAIQSRRLANYVEGLGEGDWGDDASPTWNWRQRDYRVKAVEPRNLRKEISEMIEVMQAAKEGKEIEYRVGSGPWTALPALDCYWNWLGADYRVKPVEPSQIEPKRVWVAFSPGPDHYVRATWQRKPDIDSLSSAMVVVEFIELTLEVRVKLGL